MRSQVPINEPDRIGLHEGRRSQAFYELGEIPYGPHVDLLPSLQVVRRALSVEVRRGVRNVVVFQDLIEGSWFDNMKIEKVSQNFRWII